MNEYFDRKNSVRGIDVSEHNGLVDWQAVKNAGYKFAIVRCTYGKTGEDSMFRQNVLGAMAVGIKCGAYHYSYALDSYNAQIEAEHCERVISYAGVLLELPVFFDMEDADNYKLNHGFDFHRDTITNICESFITNVRLNCGLYASYSWLRDKIDVARLGNIPVWNAQWSNQDDYKGDFWQYTDSEIVNGNYYDANIVYDGDKYGL